jgi:hypothetical protein
MIALMFLALTTGVYAAEVPGPSAAFYASHPHYTCVSNFYVAKTGNSRNNGTSPASPWDIVTATGKTLAPGSCVNLAPGIYNTGANNFDIPNGGVAPAADAGFPATTYVVWRCSVMPFSFSNGVLQGEGSGCVLRDTNSGAFNVLTINAPYVMFDALEFDGNRNKAQGVCLDNENGAPVAHHVWVFNSDMHGCGQGGIQWNATEFLYVFHNVWHDNSNTNGAAGSGASFYDPVAGPSYTLINQDNAFHSNTTGLTYHIIVEYNVGYHNICTTCGSHTDGEGIIFDDWGCTQGSGLCSGPYTQPGLAMGNVMYDNGGAGIETFSWADSGGAPVTVANNTLYDNYRDTRNSGTYRGNGYLNQTWNVSWFNNIAVAVRGSGILTNNSTFLGRCGEVPPCPSNGTTSQNNTWQTNLSYPAGDLDFAEGNSYPTTGANANLDGSNPLLTSLTPGSASNNFALKAGSPAIGFGQPFDLWQQSGAVDAGACVSSLLHCP